MVLFRSVGLSAERVAEIIAEIVEMIELRLKDDEMLKKLNEKFSGMDLAFAAFLLGRIVGMSYAIKDANAKAIIADFGRYLEILRTYGREELKKIVEKEILEETYKKIETFRDVI
ncbi:MAG: hypothetical protein QXW59_03960 [Archaeoglobaceae archaeon]|uniref:Uncharacterized protein n=1 Tax=Archaeoglobus fulgidus TaxID=2234 RepID=A0A7J3M0I7_ARCFL